jgi:hypothetical protein
MEGDYIVTHMTTATTRISKHIPGVRLSKTGHPLLGNEPINTFLITEEVFSVGFARGIIRGQRKEYNGVQEGGWSVS